MRCDTSGEWDAEDRLLPARACECSPQSAGRLCCERDDSTAEPPPAATTSGDNVLSDGRAADSATEGGAARSVRESSSLV